jgi:hypothetical protein
VTIIKTLFLLFIGGAATVGIALHDHVHSERWKVKTLADSVVIGSSPVATSIEEQLALPAPKVEESLPRTQSERTLYTLTANLVDVKKEFDGDYHLVLEDPRTHLRMIAEIPDTEGSAPERYKLAFAAARSVIDRGLGRPGLFTRAPHERTEIEITGMGFFDDQHVFTPHGMAANGREIHPVLSVKLGSKNS